MREKLILGPRSGRGTRGLRIDPANARNSRGKPTAAPGVEIFDPKTR
jgi:hypothetical protein